MDKHNNYKYKFDNMYAANPKPCGDILLYQAGENLCGDGTIVPAHNQYCFEITYVLDGKGEILTNGITEHVGKHDCYFSLPNEVHEIISDTVNPLRYCFLGYDSKNDTEINFINHALSEQFHPATARKTHTGELERLFSMLLTEIGNTDAFAGQMLAMLVKQTIITAFRSISQSCPTAYNLVRSDSSYLVYEICRYIDNHVLEFKNLNRLQSVFNYNYQYLSRQFVKITGKTLMSYYSNKRMDTARELLLNGESAVNVSDRMDYSSIHAFTRAYKKHFGYPPSKTSVTSELYTTSKPKFE